MKNDNDTGRGELRVETVGRTRLVTIDRPTARNALTLPVLVQMRDALDSASEDASLRCVVLAGAGGHFCAGADLRQNIVEDPRWMDHLESYMDAFHGLIRSVVCCTKPTLAMLDGAAVGFGADLACACDLRVASTNAYIQEKFAKIGLMPDGGGTFWLPRLVGTARAMEMILLGKQVLANELLRLGVVTRVLAPDSLKDATLALARDIELGPPLAFAAAKRAIRASWGDIEAALQREREGQLALLRSADFAEGVAAWAEKREPRFTGR